MPREPDRRLPRILHREEDVLRVRDLVADGEVMHLVAERRRGEETRMWKAEAERNGAAEFQKVAPGKCRPKLQNAPPFKRREPLYAARPPVGTPSLSSASTSASVNTRLRVKKRKPSGASSEKPPPRPGTTSMMSWVCFQ